MAQTIDHATMTAAIESGEARRIGEMADSPIGYADAYWMPGNDGWVQVETPETVEFLTDAERRLRLADEAVTRSDES